VKINRDSFYIFFITLLILTLVFGNQLLTAQAVPSPSQVITGTYYGGSGTDDIKGIAYAGDGIVVVGSFGGTNPPVNTTVRNPLGASVAAGTKGFVAKFGLDGKSLQWLAPFPPNTAIPAEVAVDSQNNIYLTGIASSGFAPLIAGFAPFQPNPDGTNDPFVAKLSADGSTLLWGTFQIGGDDGKFETNHIALASGNQPVITGTGGNAGFVAKFSADGKNRLFYTTMTNPGNPAGRVYDMAVNPVNDAVYVAGYFQIESQLQAPYLIAYNGSGTEIWRNYAVKVSGETADSRARAVTVSPDGLSVYAALTADGGTTVLRRDPKAPYNLLTLTGAYQNSYGSGGGANSSFIGKYAADSGNFQDATFFHAVLSDGKTNSTTISEIAVEANGQVAVTGSTAFGLKMTSGAIRTAYTAYEGFLTVLDAQLSRLDYSTHLGSSGDDTGTGVAVKSGKISVSGRTGGSDFSVFSPLQGSSGGGQDGFLAVFSMPGSATPVAPGYFHTVTPARLYNTGDGAGAISLGQIRNLKATGNAGIPNGATAILANLTAYNTTTGGYLTAFPSSTPVPFVSSLNWFRAGQQVANFAIIGLNASGSFDITLGGPGGAKADVIVDIFGYVDGNASGGGIFKPVNAVRLYDSRPTGTGILGKDGAFAPGVKRPVQVAGNAGVPGGAKAAVVNLTVATGTLGGYFSLYPGDLAQAPIVSSANWRAADGFNNSVGPADVANLAIVPLSSDGRLMLEMGGRAGSTAHAIIDVLGYIADDDGSGGKYAPVTPARLYDSRPNQPTTFGGAFNEQPLQNTQTRTTTIAGNLDVPVGVKAAVVRITRVFVDDTAAGGNLVMYPGGGAVPNVSSVNFTFNPIRQVSGNLGIVTLSVDGKLTTRLSGATSHYVLDLLGYIS
jgi:hypothetical protein